MSLKTFPNRWSLKMGISVQCHCDLCGKSMSVPEDYNDTGRSNDVRIAPIGCRSYTFTYACNNCLFLLRNCIDNLRNSFIDSNDEIRRKCFKAYYGEGLNNQKRLISAIKECRSLTGIGLKEAKDMCEKWRDEYAWENHR